MWLPSFSIMMVPEAEKSSMTARLSTAQSDTATTPRRELRGVVERLTYRNPENGYTVARLAPERAEGEVMAALQGYGVSTSLAVRIYKKFGDDSGRVVSQEPYRLAREVWGIGFKTADKIAQAVGIAPDAPERLQAGVLHALGAASDQGHTLLPERELAEAAATLLGAEAERLAEAVAARLATR